MRATNRTWPFMLWTREALFRPRPQEAPGTERSRARAERSRHRFERQLRDPRRAPGSCSPPIPPWVCLTRRGPAGEEAVRRVAAAVGVREAAEVRAVVVEQAAPEAAVARVVAAAREVRVAERVPPLPPVPPVPPRPPVPPPP